MADFKLLDPNRKAVLSLPDPALKLWLAYWMFESDDQEAYPSLDRLEQVSGQSRNTILKWRKYLLETGWLLRLTGYASDRYSKPTRGSHSVAVYRVNDPTKDEEGSRGEPIQATKGSHGEPIDGNDERGFTTFTPHEMNPRFIPVSMSLPLSEALPVAVTSPTSADADMSELQSLRDSKSTPTTKAKTKAKTPTTGSGSDAALPVKLKSNSKYDAPFPYDFDSWSQVDRTRWSMEHSVQTPKGSIVAEKQATARPLQPPSTPPPPAAGMLSCPECDFATRYRSSLADHVELEHPESPQLWLGPVRCPDCEWKKFYLDNNKREEYEVLLAEHIIELHGDKV